VHHAGPGRRLSHLPRLLRTSSGCALSDLEKQSLIGTKYSLYGMAGSPHAQPGTHQRETNFILVFPLTPILRLSFVETNFIFNVDLFY